MNVARVEIWRRNLVNPAGKQTDEVKGDEKELRRALEWMMSCPEGERERQSDEPAEQRVSFRRRAIDSLSVEGRPIFFSETDNVPGERF